MIGHYSSRDDSGAPNGGSSRCTVSTAKPGPLSKNASVQNLGSPGSGMSSGASSGPGVVAVPMEHPEFSGKLASDVFGSMRVFTKHRRAMDLGRRVDGWQLEGVVAEKQRQESGGGRPLGWAIFVSVGRLLESSRI